MKIHCEPGNYLVGPIGFALQDQNKNDHLGFRAMIVDVTFVRTHFRIPGTMTSVKVIEEHP
jgi:hypothetical protein